MLSTTPAEALAWAHPILQEWFLSRFGSATEPQIEGWPAILAQRPTLISAPTGSGKTFAAFLICIDQLFRKALAGELQPHTEVVYISPLKALSNDIRKNLEEPLQEIQKLALERGCLCPPIRTAVRTGDTLPAERRAMLKQPPHILVTTPESFFILLTAEKSRANLARVRTVIVDEIHAMADDKRGTHLVLSLERLDALVCGDNRLAPGSYITGRTTVERHPASLESPQNRVPHPEQSEGWVFSEADSPTAADVSDQREPTQQPEPQAPLPGRPVPVRPAPQRIGLSATQNPISLVADFLCGTRHRDCAIIEVGRRRHFDLGIEVPNDELSSVSTNAIWDDVYNRLAELALEHRSTLVFVNTRSMAERLAFQLGERLGAENVAAHHGSLSRKLRLEAERKLKAGEIKLLVATASLELGIDIGAIDLVCQINTPRALAPALQRAGRAGHWRGATPKARFFPTTRDDLLEFAAIVRALRAGALDQLEIPPQPLDVLMQQIIAACAAEPWQEDDLFALLTRAYPYRDLSRETFEELLCLLSDGIESSRGRYGAYILRDRIHGRLQARRGARSITVSNGGTIPETAVVSVILQPDGHQIATLDEDFTIDSGVGDVIQLGNASWRISAIETAGRMYVEDAHSQPPTVPFWRGEAPQRTAELSRWVCALREDIAARTIGLLPGYISQSDPSVAAAVTWLKDECAVTDAGAEQLIAYIVAGRAVLGTVPTLTAIVAERFFDEGGGMQLILHAPFGGRINKAWGLALRKRFCRGFNFELQAAATDNGLNISLAEQHSFPLADVFQFLTTYTVTELLEQASLASPIFKTRFRWDATRSLQLLRFQKGKKVPPQIQRTRGEDLLASVFPQAAACFENIEGDIQIPNHPLVREVMKDVLGEAMDLAGLIEVIGKIQSGEIRCVAVDSTVPSVFSHGLLNANPYAFLDDAPIEERRARAVNMRGMVPDKLLGEAGRLDPDAIRQVREESWPDIRDEHELHDLLYSLIVVPESILDHPSATGWRILLDRLTSQSRAHIVTYAGGVHVIAAERLDDQANLLSASPDLPLLQKSLHAWLNILGPQTAQSLAQYLGLPPQSVFTALLVMESQGTLLRGEFEHDTAAALSSRPRRSEVEGSAVSLKSSTAANVSDQRERTEQIASQAQSLGRPIPDHEIQWCERRLLQRIYKRTIHTLRKQIEPVAPAHYMDWLLRWQHLAPQTQLTGEEGVLDALRKLEGFEAPAIEWERTLLPQRVANYDPRALDTLCMAGVVGWGRISPHPAFLSPEGGAPRRVIPTSMAPITFFLREDAHWMDGCLRTRELAESALAACLSPLALRVRASLEQAGAAFAADLARQITTPIAELHNALWELVAAGLVTADGYDSLRALIDPRRKSASSTPFRMKGTNQRARNTAGRWALLAPPAPQIPLTDSREAKEQSAIAAAQQREQEIESAALVLLWRYGIVFRDLVQRETTMPSWRELLGMLRRLEARGIVRGGRFVSGFQGEQFALPQAVESLRDSRKVADSQTLDPRKQNIATITVTIAAADPANLVGIVVPGDRPAATAGRTVQFRGGHFIPENGPALAEVTPAILATAFPDNAPAQLALGHD
jgi:ATP-dependent helicase Lhr and Lhr-like helicase